MQRCSEFAYAMCPDRARCGSREDAFFMEGSECAKFNEDHRIIFENCEREEPMVKFNKEWNISYSLHETRVGSNEFFIILPSFWKVLWWFIRIGRKACDIYIWTSGRIEK